MTPGGDGGRSVLGALFRFEMVMLLRDRRTLLLSVVVPLAIWPAMILLMGWVEARDEARLEAATFEYAVTGSEAGLAGRLVEQALALPAPDAETEATADRAAADFVRREMEDGVSLLEAGEIDLVVEGMTAAEWEAESGEEGVEVPVIRLHYRDNSDFSGRALDRLRERLLELREERRAELLLAGGFPVRPESVAPVELRNTATATEEAGAVVGLALTPFIVMLMLTGGSIVAVDTIAGEKERGTLETLLTTAARRWEIVAAKQASIVAMGLAITVVNVANLLVYVVLGVFDLPESLAGLSVTPLGLVILLLLFVPLAVLVSSVLLLLSGRARSYQEYQIYFLPVFLLMLLPSGAAVLPGIELRSVVSLVPLAGVSVAVKEVMSGEYDWAFLAITFASTCAVAAWLAGLTMRALSTERLITAAELDRADLVGGPALFPRHVLRWFAVLWVVLLVSSFWLEGGLGIRGQVMVNVLGIFLGGSLLMLWRYRLDPREALALRAPPPSSWLAVLIGAPSGMAAGQGVFELASLFLPVPEEVLEAFSQYLLPESLPLWQIVLFLCVVPGVVEEIAFRGLLLHGLRRRFGPVGLCLVVGGIFGLFHVSLFRLLPTAYLGAVFAAVVLLSGSIWPAMLWHGLNNALGLVPPRLGWWDGSVPPWGAALGFVGLGLALWILWRDRRPYPGLRAGSGGPHRSSMSGTDRARRRA